MATPAIVLEWEQAEQVTRQTLRELLDDHIEDSSLRMSLLQTLLYLTPASEWEELTDLYG